MLLRVALSGVKYDILFSRERNFKSLFFSLDIETFGLLQTKNIQIRFHWWSNVTNTSNVWKIVTKEFYTILCVGCICQKVRRCPFLSGLRPENEVVGNELKLSRKDILSRACFIAAALPAPEYFVKIFVAE